MLAEDVNVFNEVFSSDEEINPKDVICSEPDIVPDGALISPAVISPPVNVPSTTF